MGKSPILVDVADPAWMHEIRMIAAVTERPLGMVDTDEAANAVEKSLAASSDLGRLGTCMGILITDQTNRLISHQRLRSIHLADVPRPLELGGVLDLARLIGMQDHPIIAVHGAVGGAGTTVMAASIAQALMDRSHPVFLVDANPHSLGFDIALGAECLGPASPRFDGEEVTFTRIAESCPRVGDIPILPRSIFPSPASQLPMLNCLEDSVVDAAAVLDCGTVPVDTPVYDDIVGNLRPDFHVVVTSNSVAGLMNARLACEKIEMRDGVCPLVVIRTRSEAELPQSLAQVVLQQYSVVRVFTEPKLATELDKGNAEYFLHDGHHLVRTGHGLLGQWEAENLLIFDELVTAADEDLHPSAARLSS